MPRIEGASPRTRNPFVRFVFWYVRRQLGRDVQPLRGYATSSAVLASTVALEVGMERARRVDPRLRQLAELRVASLVGCPFCLDIGSALVRRAGVSDRQVRELHDWRRSDAFSPLEKLVLSYADRMTATPVVIDEDEFARLREHFDEAQIVELTAAIAHENLRARINHALGYGAEGFSADGVCALPARPVPPLTPVRTVAHDAA
ncbi:MAG TPA: carboxymuconolactone decarboxylase family protein [Candidatus Binatia bacterium]